LKIQNVVAIISLLGMDNKSNYQSIYDHEIK